MRKTTQSFPKAIFAFFATVALVFGAMMSVAPLTAKGVQCPTAAVQTITVAKRDCCNRIVGFETRKPIPGERTFVQCQCAEKKSADHDAVTSTRIVFFLESPASEIVSISPPERTVRVLTLDTTYHSVNFPPSIRPPATV